MTPTTKTDVFQKLEESRKRFQQVIQTTDMDKVIYKDGGWRARDIMINIGYWEREAAKALNAFLSNSEYFVPSFFERLDEINKSTFEKFQHESYSAVESYFEEGRKQLIAAVAKFSDEDLAKEHTAFYGGKSGISQLIIGLIDHEQQHLADIEKSL